MVMQQMPSMAMTALSGIQFGTEVIMETGVVAEPFLNIS